MNRNVVKKLILLLLIAAAITLFFATGLHRHLTLEAIKSSQARFQELYNQHALAVPSGEKQHATPCPLTRHSPCAASRHA